MEYGHPCGKLKDLSTIKNVAAEKFVPCIYNDIINKEYICPRENNQPAKCKKIYYEIKSQITKIESGLEDLEKIIK